MGEGTGQVRDLCVGDDADEGLSSIDESQAQTEPGDDDPCEHPELYRSAVCTIHHMTKRRPDLQATTRWMCKRLRNPNQKSWRQLVKTVRYIKGQEIWLRSCRGQASRIPLRLFSMETGLATIWTGSRHLEVI